MRLFEAIVDANHCAVMQAKGWFYYATQCTLKG